MIMQLFALALFLPFNTPAQPGNSNQDISEENANTELHDQDIDIGGIVTQFGLAFLPVFALDILGIASIFVEPHPLGIIQPLIVFSITPLLSAIVVQFVGCSLIGSEYRHSIYPTIGAYALQILPILTGIVYLPIFLLINWVPPEFTILEMSVVLGVPASLGAALGAVTMFHLVDKCE